MGVAVLAEVSMRVWEVVVAFFVQASGEVEGPDWVAIAVVEKSHFQF